jgi:D-alanine-D-alanine ligase
VRHETGSALEAVRGEAVRAADVVFIMLHGGTGEDGTVQGLLELAGKRYTGSGVLASALAMDKRAAKVVFEKVGVPTPAWRVVTLEHGLPPDVRGGSPTFPSDGDAADAERFAGELGGYPVVVKPNDQGSTVGLTIVNDIEHLAPAVRLAGDYSRHVLIESYIRGRELTVAVLGGEALPVVEISPKSGFYDYESKYGDGMSDYTCPAEIPATLAGELKAQALKAYSAMGCAGYARVDFRLTPDEEAYCLEVNTVPGMTEHSLVPMAAAAAGISFGELVERIAKTALK